MAVEIVKTYKEQFPSLQLIGKRYTDEDRQGGSFGHKWGEWFQNGWFDEIEKLNPIPANDDAYLGAMRVADGKLEYWIGMFFEEGTQPPEGFDYADISAMDAATCWLYGNEHNGELYGMDAHNMAVAAAGAQGLVWKEDGWCFERYNCPRFTTPDDKGNVILDYCIAIV